MTLRPVAKLVALALAGLAGVVLIVALGAATMVADRDVKAAVLAALGRDAAEAFSASAVRVKAWPRLSATLDDVALGGQGPMRVTVPRLTVTLRLLPLLTGQVEIGRLTLARPTITWTGDLRSAATWTANPGSALTAAAGLPPAALDDSAPEVRLVDGRIEIHGPDGSTEIIEDVTGVVRRGAAALALSGTLRLRGDPVEATLSVGDAAALARGARTALRLALSAPKGTAAFDGHVALTRRLQLDGRLTAEGGSLRAALAWLGLDPVVRGGLGRFTLTGEAAVSGLQMFALRKASLELDGNRAEGGLTVRLEGGNATVQGTLAAETLTLDPYAAAFALRRTGGWSRDAFDVSVLAGIDADIRLSAGQMVLGKVWLGRTAGAMVVRGGQLSLTLGEAEAFAGLLRGTLALSPAPDGASVRLDAVASDVDLDRLGQNLFGAGRIDGRGNLVVGVEGHGASPAAIAHSLAGEVRVTAGPGALTGVNVEQILRRIEKRPLAATGNLRGGRTAFDKLAIQLRLADGVATCEEVVMEGPTVRITIAGDASVADRTVDLTGVAATMAPAGTATGFELPFVIRGAWENPAVVPDAESLIRRSGAAAPLLGRASRRAAPAAADVAAPPPADSTTGAETPAHPPP